MTRRWIQKRERSLHVNPSETRTEIRPTIRSMSSGCVLACLPKSFGPQCRLSGPASWKAGKFTMSAFLFRLRA